MLKKRIPTIVGLLLLLVGVVGGVIFINQGTDFLPRAAPEYVPQKVKITNISDAGFVVSWNTQEPTSGYIKYSDNPVNLSLTALDDRDQLSGSSSEYRTHYVSLQNLKPKTAYYFKLGSQKDQLYDNNGQPFSITLPNVIENKPVADTVFGTILTAVDTPAEGAIIYLSIQGATPLSALVKQNGNWAANLSLARTADLSAYASYNPDSTVIDMLVQTNEGETTTATTTTDNDQPVPIIVIGKSNIFTTPSVTPAPTPTPISQVSMQPDTTTQNLSDNPLPSPANTTSLFNLAPLTADSTQQSITVNTIPANGQVTSAQPEFSGQAPPDTTLVISVHSNTAYTGSVVTDAQGRWQWLTPAPLDSGDHTISISFTDSDGKVHSIQRDFTVSLASLQQVDLAYAATPSATPTPTPIPTALPTPTPTATPATTPEPSPTPRTTVATTSATMVAGSTSDTTLTILVGIALIGVGLGYKKLLPSR